MVWREKFPLNMLNAGIPLTFIRWLCSFLNDCGVCVKIFNVFGSNCHFSQGLPQGSVLAPLLNVLYMNNLATSLSDDTVIALFANDVSIFITACKKKDAKATAQ